MSHNPALDHHLEAVLRHPPEPEFVAHCRRLVRRIVEQASQPDHDGCAPADPPSEAVVWSRLRVEDLYLAWRCARGDEVAWRRFEEEVGPTLRGAARRYAPEGDVEEVVARTRARLFARLRGAAPAEGELLRYQGRAALGTYVWSVVRSESRGLRRERERQPASIPELPLATDPRRPPAAETATRERAQRLGQALAQGFSQLDDKARLVLQMKHEQGLSQKEVGLFFQEENPVRIHRCYKRIYDALQERIQAAFGADLPQTDEILALSRYIPDPTPLSGRADLP